MHILKIACNIAKSKPNYECNFRKLCAEFKFKILKMNWNFKNELQKCRVKIKLRATFESCKQLFKGVGQYRTQSLRNFEKHIFGLLTMMTRHKLANDVDDDDDNVSSRRLIEPAYIKSRSCSYTVVNVNVIKISYYLI